MLFLLPFADSSFWDYNSKMSYKILVSYIDIFYLNEKGNFKNSTYSNLLYLLNKNKDPLFPVINITIKNVKFFNAENEFIDIRNSDINAVFSDYLGYSILLYSSTYMTKISSIINIIATFYVCLLITISSLMLDKDTKKLVLTPIEVMFEIVETVSKNPMFAKKIDDIEGGLKSIISKMNYIEEDKNNNENHKLISSKYEEILIIQSAIIKISSLLTIGLGEAGGDILRENFSIFNELNPIIKGKMKMAIFCFCDIKQFIKVNEALQENTIVFVNEIAEIVHLCVDKYGGAPNKNMGDAFLNVWKFKKKSNIKFKKNILEDDVQTFNPELNENRLICDLSLLSTLSIIININSHEKILAYQNHPEILKKIDNYKVNMGFGLHLGWAIEGSIGSTYKIDASYLSPNVNISARLEGATKQYGVPILISGQLFDSLSDDLKNKCRLIDIVTLKGAVTVTKLYTIDVNLDFFPKKKKITSKKEIKLKRKEIKLAIINYGSVGKYMMSKKSFIQLFNIKRPSEFLSKFIKGFNSYIEGNWMNAMDLFKECLILDPNDGPTKNLSNFISSYNNIKPSSWMGYRILSSK